MAALIGYATLQLIPSLAGVGLRVRQQLGGELGGVGRQAGERVGENVGEGLRAKALIAAGAAGLAVGAALIASTVSAMNTEAVTDKLTAQLDLSGPAAEAAGKAAGDLYTGAYAGSVEEGAAIVKVVSQNIGADINSPDFGPLTQKVADVANAFDQDLGGTTTAVGQLMRTGLAKDATDALNIITAGLQGPANSADDLLDTFTEYPALFQRLGIDGATSLGLIEQGLAAGARNSDLVADALKEFQIRATDGSKTSAEGFKALGLNAEKLTAQIAAGGEGASAGLDQVLDKLRAMEDPVARNAAAVALFGTQAEDLGGALFALDPSAAAAGLGDLSTKVTDLGKTLNDNATTNLTTFWRTIQTAFVDTVGGQVLPVVNQFAAVLATNVGPALSAIGSALSASIGFYQQNADVINALGIVVGVLAIGIAGIAVAATVASGAMAAWFATTAVGIGITQGLAVANFILNAVVQANPFVKVAVVVLALVGALVYFFTQTETGKAIVEAVWAAIQTAIGATVDYVTGTVVPALQSAWDAVMSAVTTVKDWVIGVFGAIVDFFVQWWPLLLVIFAPGIALIIGLWNRFGDDIINFTLAAWALVRDHIVVPLGEAFAKVGEFIGAAVAFIAARWAEIRLGAQVAWALIKENIVRPVAEFIAEVVAKLLGFALKVVTPIIEAKDQAITVAKGFLGVGAEIISGLLQGLGNGVEKIKAKAREVAQGALDAAKNVLGIKSPSRAFIEVGQFINEGLVIGLSETSKDVEATTKKIAENVYKGFKDVVGNEIDAQVAGIDASVAGLKRQVEALSKTAEARKKNAGQLAKLNDQIDALNAQRKTLNSSVEDIVNARSQALLASISEQTAALSQIAIDREIIAGKIKVAGKELEAAIKLRDDFADSVAEQAIKLGSLSDFARGLDKGETLNASFLLDGLRDANAAAATFDELLGKLASSAASDDVFRQIAGAGVEQGTALARALLEGGDAAIKEANELTEKLRVRSEALGKATAGHLYDAGVQSAQGLLDGLVSKEDELFGKATQIAEEIANRIRKALDIHSPSRVMATIGGQIGAGLVKGIDATRGAVGAAVDALVPLPRPGSSAAVGAVVAGARPGSGASVTLHQTNTVERPVDVDLLARKSAFEIAGALG